MTRKPHTCPQRAVVEGNNGGSYIHLEETETEGVCFLEVGETCIRTVSAKLSVVQLAAILSWAEDYGFQRILDEYDNGVLSNWKERA